MVIFLGSPTHKIYTYHIRMRVRCSFLWTLYCLPRSHNYVFKNNHWIFCLQFFMPFETKVIKNNYFNNSIYNHQVVPCLGYNIKIINEASCSLGYVLQVCVWCSVAGTWCLCLYLFMYVQTFSFVRYNFYHLKYKFNIKL